MFGVLDVIAISVSFFNPSDTGEFAEPSDIAFIDYLIADFRFLKPRRRSQYGLSIGRSEY